MLTLLAAERMCKERELTHEWVSKADDGKVGTNGRKFKWTLLDRAFKNDPQYLRPIVNNFWGQSAQSMFLSGSVIAHTIAIIASA